MIDSILARVRDCLLPVVLCGLTLLATGCSDNGDGNGNGDFQRQIDSACVNVSNTIDNLASAPTLVNYGFFTDFDPLSYATTQDSDDPAFNMPMGYEPALISAVNRLSNDQLQFTSIGIGNPFSGIWLLSATDGRFDMVGGGITALEGRRYAPNDPETALITFGAGHVQFRQSLLVRSESTIMDHDDLDSSTTVGALRGTTGESRLLQLVGITDDDGWLRASTVITFGDNATLVTGERTHKITGSDTTPGLEERTRLQAPGDDVPLIVYLPSETAQIEAVTNGDVDAVARGEIGNLIAANNSDGALRVTAVDTENTESGAFSYPNTTTGDNLRTTMNDLINCLTDNGNIGFAEWNEDSQTFQTRATRNAP